MEMEVQERTRRVVFRQVDTLGLNHLDLVKFYKDDAVARLKRNVQPETDVIITFPLFKFIFNIEDETIEPFPSNLIPEDVQVVHYKDAFRHLTVSRQAIAIKRQHSYINRRMRRKTFRVLTL